MTFQEFLQIILQYALTPILALLSLITTFIRTREKSISFKVDKSLSSSLKDYYVLINGVEYNLSDLSIYKKKTAVK